MRLLKQVGKKLLIGVRGCVIVLSMDEDSSILNILKTNEEESTSAIEAIASCDETGLCVAGFNNKWIYCWNTNTGELISSKQLKKRPVSIVIPSVSLGSSSKDRKVTLFSDKSSEIWATDIPMLKSQVLLGGHTASVITEMASFQELIATADRDEKIRVSSFPCLESIQSFCVGHLNVISSIAFFSMEDTVFLLSASWDHQLILWNPLDGSMKASLKLSGLLDEMEQNPVDSTVDDNEEEEENENEKAKDENKAGNFPFRVVFNPTRPIFAVLRKSMAEISFYEVFRQGSSIEDFFEIKEICLQKLPDLPCDVIFIDENHVLVLLPKPHYLLVFDLSDDKECAEIKDKFPFSKIFQEKCLELGIDFTQKVTSTDAAFEGLKKHELDKPFDVVKNINKERKPKKAKL